MERDPNKKKREKEKERTFWTLKKRRKLQKKKQEEEIYFKLDFPKKEIKIEIGIKSLKKRNNI